MAATEQPKITLHWLNRSRSQRIIWLLEELKLPYELEIYHRNEQTRLAPPELEKVHPMGKSPVITIQAPGADEPIVLAESGFITQYLVENTPEGSKLMPKRWRDGMEGKMGGETEAWMRYQYYLHFAEGSFMPIFVLALFIGGLKSPAVPFFIRPITSLVANRIFAMYILPNTKRSLALLETHLSTGGGQSYLCSNELTAADILMSFPLTATKDKLDEFGAFEGGSWRAQFPRVAEYVERLEANEGYKASVAKIEAIDGKMEPNICVRFFELFDPATVHRNFTEHAWFRGLLLAAHLKYGSPTSTSKIIGSAQHHLKSHLLPHQSARLIAMSASRAICSRCSSQLRSVAVQRLGAVARFATLGDPPDHSHSLQMQRHMNESEVQRQSFQSSTTPFNGAAKGSQDPALALFNDVVSPASNELPSGDLAERRALGELEIVAKIDELLKKGLAMQEEYEAFREDIWPHVKEMPGQVPMPVYNAVTMVLGKMRSQLSWVGGESGNSLEVAEMYSKLGRSELRIRNDLVMNICYILIEVKCTSSRRTLLMNELITLWKHISQLKRASEVLEKPRFALPSTQDVLEDLNRQPNVPEDQMRPLTLERALASLFLAFPPPQAATILPGLLSTVAILSDPRFSGPGRQTEAAPLLNLVRLVLSRLGSELNETNVGEIFRLKTRYNYKKQQKLRDYVVRQLGHIAKMLLYKNDQWQGGLASSMDPEMAKTKSLSTFHQQLRVAYGSRNTGAILAIWQNMISSLQDYPKLGEEIRNDPHFLDFWVFVWCGVRRANKLQETMELMNELGVQPTVKTYTSMLHGWKMCKDTAKIEALWSQLIQSGLQLDVVIWTARISALIDGGRPQDGINALIQMVTTWKNAVKSGHEADAVEPTIAVVNAAFNGLLRLGDPQKANEVLAWAGREGFMPDVRTYNILLRETLRTDDSESAKDLLRSMRRQGIEPDSATFTILLEGVISRMGDDASSEEQVRAVNHVFADIEAAKLKPNLETYAKMLYSVARLPNGSDDAVAAVQAHMVSKGMKVTAHMVTILIERALTQDPPDIDAVRELLHKHKLKSVDQGDQTLWERVVSAYSVAGEPDEALAIFDELANAGRPVTSLPCLLDLVRMLLDRQDREAAERVVSVALAHKLKSSEKFNDRYWRHHFWYMARENGLLKRANLPEELIKHIAG
ncbi:glutathione S-transferase [Dactylonectria macrodidyma]|uniref:glutathione transferase n=1 Tax=Dactylonectria macrodidyma TaxID=307937 RepID=A0A9P9J298_9HYPO|nr:glutathione S-transferase [Dactylonectria macrodidyma]